MNPLKRIFTTASATLGTIPGLAVLGTGLGTPPGQRILFSAAIETVGVLCLLLAWANRPTIRHWPSKHATRVVVWMLAGGIAALILYIVTFRVFVVSLVGRETVMFPLWSAGDLADMIAASGGRTQAVLHYGAGAINEAAAAMPIAQAFTISALLLLYLAIFTAFVLAFGIAGIRQH